MKQYKFKCPICGKWHDVYNSGIHQGCQSSTSASCMDAKLLYKGISLDICHSSINGLLRLLRKLNIEVAEVCDKVRWKRPNVVFDSSLVWRGYGVNGKKYYYMVVKHGESNYIASRLNCRKPIKRTCKTLKSAKAACQADFQKRRAK